MSIHNPNVKESDYDIYCHKLMKKAGLANRMGILTNQAIAIYHELEEGNYFALAELDF